MDARNKRIFDLLNNKMRFMFKEVLTSVEKESKQFVVNTDFFGKQKGRPRGFYGIRKTLFDHGNGITKLLEIILDQVAVTPTQSIVTLDPKLQKEIEKDK